MEFTKWLIRLKHAFIAAGYSRNNFRLDREGFRPFFNEGLSPIEMVLLDMEEGGEL